MKPAHVLAVLLTIALIIAVGAPDGAYVEAEVEALANLQDTVMNNESDWDRFVEELETMAEIPNPYVGAAMETTTDFDNFPDEPIPTEQLREIFEDAQAQAIIKRFTDMLLGDDNSALSEEFSETCSSAPEGCFAFVQRTIEEIAEEAKATGKSKKDVAKDKIKKMKPEKDCKKDPYGCPEEPEDTIQRIATPTPTPTPIPWGTPTPTPVMPTK